MAEWSNAAVLKTVDLHGSGGSNPSLSAEKGVTDICSVFFDFSVTKNVTKIVVRHFFTPRKFRWSQVKFFGLPSNIGVVWYCI